jgi:hypothetical protein
MTPKHVFATAARLVGRHLAAPKLPEGLWQRPLSAHTGQKITRKKMRQNFVRKKSKNSLYDTKTRICHRGPPRRQTPCSPEVARRTLAAPIVRAHGSENHAGKDAAKKLCVKGPKIAYMTPPQKNARHFFFRMCVYLHAPARRASNAHTYHKICDSVDSNGLDQREAPVAATGAPPTANCTKTTTTTKTTTKTTATTKTSTTTKTTTTVTMPTN